MWRVRGKEARKEWSEARQRFIGAAWGRVRRWKETGLDAAEAAREDRPRRTDEEESAAKVYVSYQDELDRRHLCDFPDLVLRTVLIFARTPVYAALEPTPVTTLLVYEARDG